MRLPKLFEVLTRSPLALTPAAADSYLTLFHYHAMITPEKFKATREGKDICGDKVELEQMVIEGSLALLPIKGPLGIDLGAFEKGAGATDYLDIQADIRKAEENDKVENILAVFDTPGGMWGGLPETTKMISKCSKPIWAYVPPGGQCCSAGLHLAAGCNGRFLAPSAQMGSIGVYCAYTDFSERAKMMGIKVKVFSSGIYKGMGVPGTELTEAQEQFLQDSVMELAQEFYDHIRANLGDVPDDAMQGQSFRSSQAVAIGLANEVVQSLDEMKSFLR